MKRIWYVQIIYNIGLIPIFYLILKETRHEVILAKRAKKIRKETGKPVYAMSECENVNLLKEMDISFRRPMHMLLTEPVVTFFTLWISFGWGILFLFQNSVVQTFTQNYHFNTLQSGTVQLAITVGAAIGTAVNPIQDTFYLRSAKRNHESRGVPIPEARLYSSVPGTLFFAGGLFWYGWGSNPHVHWIVPACGIASTGLGIYSIYMAVVDYLTDGKNSSGEGSIFGDDGIAYI